MKNGENFFKIWDPTLDNLCLLQANSKNPSSLFACDRHFAVPLQQTICCLLATDRPAYPLSLISVFAYSKTEILTLLSHNLIFDIQSLNDEFWTFN